MQASQEDVNSRDEDVPLAGKAAQQWEATMFDPRYCAYHAIPALFHIAARRRRAGVTRLAGSLWRSHRQGPAGEDEFVVVLKLDSRDELLCIGSVITIACALHSRTETFG